VKWFSAESAQDKGQPLVGMNDTLIREWSRELATRVLNDAGLSPEQQVERAFRIVFTRAPGTKNARPFSIS